MRRNATKVAAAVLTLAVTMTSINIPTTAAAAKKVKLTPAKKTLKVGETVTLKLKEGNKNVTTKAKFTSSNKKIATVGKKGKVKAKKKGTATITATYKKKKYKCKITVKKKATTKPTTAPTQKPVATDKPAEPTTAPTQAPSTEPTTAPTQAPSADTVGAITSVEAKSATTIVATFESALPATAVLTLTKGTTDTGVKAVIDEARTTATFTSASKYAIGTYTVTATAGESKQSKDVEIKEQAVQDIVIKSKTALTDHDKKKLYVYYDVVDQYGESMRTSTAITWTSGSGLVKSDKSTGCLTIEKSDDKTEFTYGTNIYIVGVEPKSGKSVQATIPVGMERALDTIKFEGFINTDDKGTILETLPKDFAKGKYRLLFTVYDQEGQEMLADKSFTDSKKPKVTFIADNPTLIKPEFNGSDVFTVKGKKYCSVTVEPGMYIDKGGEVNITAISNTTGNRTTKNFVIGNGAVLKSLSLSAPTDVVADGDINVNIPFVAKDADGKEITNYETIVRSTNALKLTASAGILTVYENDNGTAGIKWSDTVDAKDFDEDTSSARDGVDRPVSLVTTVIGGESSNVMMYVSDTRRPVAVSSVKLNDDNNNVITEDNEEVIDVFSDKVKYIDQYGKVLDDDKAQAFFEATNGQKKGFDGKRYGVKVDYSAIGNYIDITAMTSAAIQENIAKEKFIVLQNRVDSDKGGYLGNIKFETNGVEGRRAVTENIKYSVVRLEDEDDKDKKAWDMVDTDLSVDYTIAPVRGLSNLRIRDIAKVQLETEFTNYENGSIMDPASGSAVALKEKGKIAEVKTKRPVIVEGSYEGKAVAIPRKFYNYKDFSKTFELSEDGKNVKIDSLIAYKDSDNESAAIRYNDLYDFNTARYTRKDARKNITVEVYGVSNSNLQDKDTSLGQVKTSVAISDAISYPVKVVFHQNRTATSNIILKATNTDFSIKSFGRIQNAWESSLTPAVLVINQYGDAIGINDSVWKSIEYSISNPVENSGEFAHLSKSFSVNQNNSENLSINGAEIMDKFDLTATVAGTTVNAKASVTMGSDNYAYIDSLGYDENVMEWVKDDKGNDVQQIVVEDGKKITLRDTLGYDR